MIEVLNWILIDWTHLGLVIILVWLFQPVSVNIKITNTKGTTTHVKQED